MYKIDTINQKILIELDRNCRISDTALAKKVGRSKEAVRMRINKLIKDGIIQLFITSINPSKLGFIFFKLYFQLKNIPKEREKFYDHLKSLEGIFWLGSNDGVWDCHMTLYAKTVEEFNDLKNSIYSDFKDLIIKRDTGVLVKTRQYVKNYIADEMIDDRETYFAGDIVSNEIDDVDIRIINTVIRNARISLTDLAAKTDSSIDIVRYRLKQMEKKNIITNYRIAIDHNKLGFTMFKAFLYFDNLNEKNKQKLFEYCRQHMNIVYIIEQLSSWDFEVELMVKDYQQFISIMDELRMMFQNSLRNYESVLMHEDIWTFGDKRFV